MPSKWKLTGVDPALLLTLNFRVVEFLCCDPCRTLSTRIFNDCRGHCGISRWLSSGRWNCQTKTRTSWTYRSPEMKSVQLFSFFPINCARESRDDNARNCMWNKKWRRHLFSQLRKRNFSAMHSTSHAAVRSSPLDLSKPVDNALCIQFSTFLFFWSAIR